MWSWKVRMLVAVVALGSAIGLSATLAGQSGASVSRNDIDWRFFGGDAKALVAHLVREEELAPGDLTTVRRMLKEGAGDE